MDGSHTLVNPYDFANPVVQNDLFAGRGSELSDIRYYLRHAATARRPINLALLGDRASGKTSLLNMIEFLARGQNLLTVRIDLDEGDTANPFAFFIKLFDAVLTAVCREGAFGGLRGLTYQTYITMVHTQTIPHDLTSCPFLFPIQYAQVSAAGRANDVPIFDNHLKVDLGRIAGEHRSALVILFDECNVLSGSRVILEKLRNVFMNREGFMLVFAGTPQLFPVMDEVFSPIMRQFKRVDIRGFTNLDDTVECIRKPLLTLQLDDPEALFNFENETQLREIHTLTGGRPYEIQLLCHAMFKRVQERRSSRMSLDIAVLEDVRRNLVSSQDMYERNIVREIQKLDEKELRALRVLCWPGGSNSVKEAWQLEYIFEGTASLTLEELARYVEAFESAGIVRVQEGAVRFWGDELDGIYLKYYARGRGERIPTARAPLELALSLRIDGIITGLDGLNSPPMIVGGAPGEDINVGQLIARLGDVTDEQDIATRYDFEVADIYPELYADIERVEFALVRFSAEVAQVRVRFMYFVDVAFLESIEAGISERLGPVQTRAAEVGARVDYETSRVAVPDRNVILGKLCRSENHRLRQYAGQLHAMWLVDNYLRGNLDVAGFHADAVSRLGADLDASGCNNVGYFEFARGRRSEALALLEKAIRKAEAGGERRQRDPISVLARYNISVVRALEGAMKGALEGFQEVSRDAETLPRRHRRAGCLFMLVRANGDLSVEEVRAQPDLGELSRSALNVLVACQSNAWGLLAPHEKSHARRLAGTGVNLRGAAEALSRGVRIKATPEELAKIETLFGAGELCRQPA